MYRALFEAQSTLALAFTKERDAAAKRDVERLGVEFRGTYRDVEASLKSIGEGFCPLLPAGEPLLTLAVMPKTARLERVRTAFVFRQAEKDGLVKHVSGDRGDPRNWIDTEKGEEAVARWRQAQQSPLRGQTILNIGKTEQQDLPAPAPMASPAASPTPVRPPSREELERLGRSQFLEQVRAELPASGLDERAMGLLASGKGACPGWPMDDGRGNRTTPCLTPKGRQETGDNRETFTRQKLLTNADQKEQLSLVYVKTLAAGAGFSTSEPDLDRDSVDLRIQAGGRFRPALDLQLKAMTKLGPEQNGCRSFPLRIKNYNDLRIETQTLQLLTVLELLQDKSRWMKVTPEELILRIWQMPPPSGGFSLPCLERA